MAELEDFVGGEPLNLNDLIPEQEAKPTGPESSIKTRAAYATMLASNPDMFKQDYQAMLAEGKEGKDFTRKTLMEQAQKVDSVQDINVITNILADPSLNDAQKQQAIESYRSGFNSEPATMLAMQSYAAPSKGESPEGEMVRISGADQFREIKEWQDFKQGVVNRHKVMINQDGVYKTIIPDLFEVMIPFATNKLAAQKFTEYAKLLKIDTNAGKAFVLPGSLAKDIRDTLDKLPPDKKLEVSRMIAMMIEDNKGIVFQDENKFNEYQQLQAFIGGDYSNIDKWIDNAVTLLDVIGLGSPIKGITSKVLKNSKARGSARERYLEGEWIPAERQKEENKIVLRSVTNQSNPAAPANLIKETNPEKAKAAYQMAQTAEKDEVSMALYGASKADVAFHENMPQPHTVDEAVETKVVAPEAAILDAADDTGAIWYSERERQAAKAHVSIDMQTLAGLKQHDNLSSIEVDGAKIKINAVFGTREGGFLKAEEAFNQAKFALKDYGVIEKDLQLLKREAGEYIPVNFDEVKGVDGDYLVRLKMDYAYKPEDVGVLDKTNVRLNFFDSIPSLRSASSGTAANHIVDNASMLDPLYTASAAVASDLSVRLDKLLLEQHAKFADAYLSLPKARQEKLFDHILEANEQGLELSDLQLTAKGFAPNEIQALKDWRKAWDTHYYFENADVAKTLRSRGFKLFENGSDRFFAKPVQKNQNIGRAYNPITQTLDVLTKQEMDDLYNKGGYYAEFRSPIKVGGYNVSHMIVDNTPSSYLRDIRPTDTVLNYRKGYFQTRYNAPKFIEEIVRDNAGKELYRRAVGVAGSTEEANHIKSRLATSQQRSPDDFNVRGDVKDFRPDTDYYWDIQNASGRIAQRYRGKQLEDATAVAGGFDNRYVVNPVESAIRAARSLSSRIATRDQIEVAKRRAMDQYEEFFPLVDGRRQWVENSNSLVNPGKMTTKEIQDARTTVEYINYLQNGYVNALDETFKAGFNKIADMMQKYSYGEKAALYVADWTPTAVGKSGVYQAYIALNPFRQFLVQSHQGLRAAAINPAYVMSGRLALDGNTYFKATSGIVDIKTLSKADREMVEFVQKSGMLDAIDRSNLVRGSLTDMAESANPLKRWTGKILAVPRKLGFDAGEGVNLVSHILAQRDLAIRQGKNLADKSVRDQVYATARALTYDMNFAGDMPYNQNAMGLFMQFFQVPHKAFLQYTNRKIDGYTKLRMGVLDTLLWGVPGAAILEKLIPDDMLPESPELRERIIFGLESTGLNKIFSTLAGKDVNIDFSSLSPYGVDGFAHMFTAIATGGIAELIQQSPAYSLYFKDGSKMQEAIGRMARYTGFIDTQAGLEKEDALSVLKGVVEISSGWSNFHKAKLIYEMGKIQDKTGGVLKDDATWIHAAAQMFGFRTQEEAFFYAFSKETAKGSKAYKEEVEKSYKDYIRILARDQQLSNQDDEYIIKVLGAMRLLWKDDPMAMEIVNKNLSRDIVSMQDKIVSGMLKYSKIPTASDNDTALKNLEALGDPRINETRKLFEDMQNIVNKEEE